MTDANPVVLDALAVGYANALENLLTIGAVVESLRAIEDGLNELDKDWRENIDPLLQALVEDSESELMAIRKSLPPILKATEQFAARSTVNGGIYDFFGFFDDAEGVQDAINMTGRPQNFEVVRRLNTEWVKV